MNLAQALRVSPRSRIAFVGAGGKTSGMFRLARQFKQALVSATTHLAVEQLALADNHQTVGAPQDIRAIRHDKLPGITVFTGEQIEGGRVKGLSMQAIAELESIANDLNAPLFIEADGSRQLPLKAPGLHEPLIPQFVKQVVCVAGLSAIGKPLTSETVHRPERLAELCDCVSGEVITPEMVSRLLLHPDGGLRGVPAGASRWALLNQVGTDELKSVASRIAGDLLGEYWGAVVADIPHYSLWDSLSGDDSAVDRDVHAVRVPVAGVILAAGGAHRLGAPKQILPWRGKPLVAHVVRAALDAGLDPVIVVIGASAPEVADAVADLPVNVVNNASWEAGQSASIKTGLAALPERAGAAVFLQADQPLVSSELIGALVDSHARSRHPIVAPLVDGERSSPALFDRSTFADLELIEGDVGGRRLFSRYSPHWLVWYDRSVRLDVDTEADYKRLLEDYP